MAWDNQTFNSDFILLGIFNYSPTHIFLFSLVLAIFTVAFMGNTAMILLIYLDTQLYTPMYFFLNQLSLMDLMLICNTVPKMAFNYLSGSNSISVVECATQIFLYTSLLGCECFLWAVMAYDRYIAICYPLRYPNLMSPKICGLMAASSWILGSTDCIIDAVATFFFSYCGSREIDHFFCGFPSLLIISCNDTSTFEEGHRKVFATCSSHLMVVGMYYGTALFIYLQPTSDRSPTQDKMVSVFYTILTPMLNPLIYSLCNKEVARAAMKVLEKGKSGQ
ncbi:unnamed protein product [Nyctereutes procyonoides]|uniref:(raccoon dog) hypothetical protein n=1 Tax=Nyctereutes procyonoides TaxID=34880 RepID=A0A811YQA7_NYCPR|nr:unnamed protein product [Nyctereutes procyonoides]